MPQSRLDSYTQHERPITKVREQRDYMDDYKDMKNTEGQRTEYKIVKVLDLG